LRCVSDIGPERCSGLANWGKAGSNNANRGSIRARQKSLPAIGLEARSPLSGDPAQRNSFQNPIRRPAIPYILPYAAPDVIPRPGDATSQFIFFLRALRVETHP